jgi:hypothetical protein
MDIVGHVLLGVAVTGQCTPYTVAMSLVPDIGSLPLQSKRIRDNIDAYPALLTFYRFWHSPLILLWAYFLPDPAFMLIATHIVADMFTHKRPYSEFPVYQWDYNSAAYYLLLASIGAIAWARLFY